MWGVSSLTLARELDRQTAQIAKAVADAEKWRRIARVVFREKRKLQAALDRALREW